MRPPRSFACLSSSFFVSQAAAKQAAAVKAAEAKRNAVKKAAERAAEAKRIAAQKAAEKAAEAKRNASQQAPEKAGCWLGRAMKTSRWEARSQSYHNVMQPCSNFSVMSWTERSHFTLTSSPSAKFASCCKAMSKSEHMDADR